MKIEDVIKQLTQIRDTNGNVDTSISNIAFSRITKMTLIYSAFKG